MAFFNRRKNKKKKEASPAPDAAVGATQDSPPAEEAPEPKTPPEALRDAPPKDQAKPAPEEQLAAPPEDDSPAPAAPARQTAENEKKGLFGRLKSRLGKTREKISGSIDRMTFGKQIDEDTLDELEEVLVTADLGVATTMELIEGLRGKVKRKELTDADALKKALQESIGKLLAEGLSEPVDRTAHNPHVIMVVGGKRRGQDHHHRQAGPALHRPGPQGAFGRRRHLPGRGGGAAFHLVRAHRRTHRAPAARGRPLGRGL